MYNQSNDTLPTRPLESHPAAVVSLPAPARSAPRRSRARPKAHPLPGALLLARMAGDPAAAPEWLRRAAAGLEAAGRSDRPLAARLADLGHVLAHWDNLYAERLPEVQQWFAGPESAGRTLAATLPEWTETLLAEAGTLIRSKLAPELAAAGIELRPVIQLDESQRGWLHRYFMRQVYPLLTPLAVDSGHPFPYISSDSLNLLVELRRPEITRENRSWLMARVKVPSRIPKLIAVPSHDAYAGAQAAGWVEPRRFVASGDLVRFFVHHLFTGMPVRHVSLFRVVRGNTPLPGARDREAGRRGRQQDQPVVRLDVEQRMAGPVLDWLTEHLHVPAHGVAHHESLLEATSLAHLARLVEETAAVR